MRSPEIDLCLARTVAVEAAEAAGTLVRDGLFRQLEVHEKGSRGDVVTDLDTASEALIIERVQRTFPGHRIISEEAGAIDGDLSWTWLIDPIDGTNNIVIGLPVLAVGITLCRERVPVVSVVHDPISGRTWSAIRERGAWDADGLRLQAPGSTSARRPVLAWIQGYEVDRNDVTALTLRLILAHRARRLIELWAPLPCWMMLVRGDIEGIVGFRIGEIDLHPGALIATEAGLAVREFSGLPFVSRLHGMNESRSIIAGSSASVDTLIDAVTSANRLEDRMGPLLAAGLLES